MLYTKIFLFTSFIRIHWYTVPPTFQFTVREDRFDYIVFFSNGNIKYDTTFYA
jgi:hypothetical protein